MVEAEVEPSADEANSTGFDNVKPIGKGVFGNIYDQFKGKAQAAIDFLRKVKGGVAKSALHHKDVGDIDLWYGDDKAGLKKIASKHPEVLEDLQSVLDKMRVTHSSDNRIILESGTHKAIVSKDWYGKKADNWLLTAYEKKVASGGSIDIVPEPEKGRQNGTAPLQDNLSNDKDSKEIVEKQEKTEKNATQSQERVAKAASLRSRHAQLSEEIKQKQLEYRFMNDRKKQYQARQELNKLYDEIEGIEQQLKETGEPMQVKRFERPAKKERTQHAARKAYDEMRKKYKDDSEVMEILDDTEPQDIYEQIGIALGSSKLLFKSKGEGASRKRGIADETGWKWNDVKGMFQLFDNEKGQSVQNWAETFWADLDEGTKNRYSSTDIANMMLDVLGGASTIGDLRNIVLANRVRQAEELLEHREKEEEYWRDMERHEQEMKDAEEEAMLEQIKDLAENLDWNEINGILADEYVKEEKLKENGDERKRSDSNSSQSERSGVGDGERKSETGRNDNTNDREDKNYSSVERPTGEIGADSQEDGREPRRLDSQRVSQERAGLSAKEREIVNRVNVGIDDAISDLDAEIRDLEKKGDEEGAEAARLEKEMLENSREDMIDDALAEYADYEENKGNMTSYEKAAAERQQKSLADRKAKRMRELLDKLHDPNTSDAKRRAVVRQLADLGVDASGYLEGRNEIKEIEEVDGDIAHFHKETDSSGRTAIDEANYNADDLVAPLLVDGKKSHIGITQIVPDDINEPTYTRAYYDYAHLIDPKTNKGWQAVGDKIDEWNASHKKDEQGFDDGDSPQVRFPSVDAALKFAEWFEASTSHQEQRGAGGVLPSAEEVALRDGLVDVMRNAGVDVITDDNEAQRVLSEANGRVMQMGTTTRRRQEQIGKYFDGRNLSEQQRLIVDVFSEKNAEATLSINDIKGKLRRTIFRQGQDSKAGVKHSVFRHYNTNVNNYTADEILFIPDIVNQGMRKQSGNKVSYSLDKNGITYTVTTQLKSNGEELFTNYYTNRKPTAGTSGASNTATQHAPQQSVSGAKLQKVVEPTNEEGEKIDNDTLFKAAKKKFGVTHDLREAGYILPDGTMLDFSGRHELFGADDSGIRGRRATDHRVISSVAYDYDQEGNEIDTGIETNMPDFIRRGAIRIDYNNGSINLSTAPTSEQRNVLRRLITGNDGDVYVDFGDGWDSDHYAEYSEAKPSRVLSDIENYFRDGIKPSGNVRLFRTEAGEVYGFVKDGKIYLDPKLASSETAVHEYTHLWSEALRKNNPKAWEQLKSELLKDKDTMDVVKKLYPELEGDELMDEVFSNFSGKRGAEKLRAEQERLMNEAKDESEKSRIARVFDRIKRALDKYWNMARDLMAGKTKGIEKLSAEDFADMALNDLLRGEKPDAEGKQMRENRATRYEEMARGYETSSRNTERRDRERDLRYRKGEEIRPTFYSNAERAVEGIKQNKATAEQWNAMLTKAGGIKAGEDKWMGLSEWLDENRSKSLTKDEVLQFIADNGIEMEETTYSEAPQSFDSLKREYDQWLHDEGFDYAQEQLRERFGDDADIAFDDLGGELVIANEKAAAALLGSDDIINQTRLDYTTEGLENKREIAFVVPGVEPYQEGDAIHFGPENQGKAVMWVRFGETTDADGKRVLVIDEIQSNRHQDAREKGYRERIDREALEEEEKRATNNLLDYRRVLRVRYQNLNIDYILNNLASTDEIREYRRLQGIRTRIDNQLVEWGTSSGVPAAPFERNWHEVAMKRMLRLAAEEGFDKVAWTTGEQQAVRYDIGDAVNGIYYGDWESTGENDVKRVEISFKESAFGPWLEVDREGKVVQSLADGAQFVGHNLQEILGKDIAGKILADGSGDIEREGLRIGGEGMKGFYDQILPRFMDKYGKKWGVKTGTVELPNVEEAGRTMHAVDVTTEMKESVMQGQPLFRLSGNEKIRVERDNARFNEEVERLTEKNADATILQLGMPSGILKSVGIADKPMRLYGNKLMSKARKHGFSLSEIKNLPIAVSDPIMIFEGSDKGSHSILTELKTASGNVLANIAIGKGNMVDFNIIRSVYGKNEKGITKWILDKKMLYSDKERALDFLNNTAPIAGIERSQELDNVAKIIKEFENPSDLVRENAINKIREAVEAVNGVTGGRAKVVREADLGKDVPKNAQAWYDPNTGEVHVVAERVNGAEDASRAVWHEEIGEALVLESDVHLHTQSLAVNTRRITISETPHIVEPQEREDVINAHTQFHIGFVAHGPTVCGLRESKHTGRLLGVIL